MELAVKFEETNQEFEVEFEGYISGYDEGFVDGYAVGFQDGERKGHDDGYQLGLSTGIAEGKAEGKAEGIEEGKQLGVTENMGTRIYIHNYQGNFLYAFAGIGWSDKTYATYFPPEDAVMTIYNNASNMYAYSNITDTKIPIDISNLKNNSTGMFSHARNMVTIRLLKVSENTGVIGFTNSTKLANITFEGTIANNLNMQWCPLTVESMKNIISCLKQGAGKTLTFMEDCWTALEADSTAPDGKTWREYVTTTLGWNS